MIIKVIQSALIFLLLSLATNYCIAQNTISAEEYEVYNGLIKSLNEDNETSHLVIKKQTYSEIIEGIAVKYITKKLSLDTKIIEDYNKQNRLESEIQNQFKLRSKITLVGDEIQEILKRPQTENELIEAKSWENFRQKYQTTSLLTLSRVGFNEEKNKALVVYGYQSGWLGGEGTFYLLTKKNNSWKIKKKVRAWIS